MRSTQSMADAMKGVAKAMRSMNRQINLPGIQKIMQDFERESEIMDMKEEMMNDAIDDAVDDENDEEETETIVNQVLEEIGINLTQAVRPARAGNARGRMSYADWVCACCAMRRVHQAGPIPTAVPAKAAPAEAAKDDVDAQVRFERGKGQGRFGGGLTRRLPGGLNVSRCVRSSKHGWRTCGNERSALLYMYAELCEYDANGLYWTTSKQPIQPHGVRCPYAAFLRAVVCLGPSTPARSLPHARRPPWGGCRPLPVPVVRGPSMRMAHPWLHAPPARGPCPYPWLIHARGLCPCACPWSVPMSVAHPCLGPYVHARMCPHARGPHRCPWPRPCVCGRAPPPRHMPRTLVP